MKEWLKDIAQALHCAYHQKKETLISGVAIDSRKVVSGDLFIALEGVNTDGHQYLQEAIRKGAAAVMISKPQQVDCSLYENYIVANNGVEFLQQLAHWIRGKASIPVIAVTGSVGKTSTKDFLATLLSTQGPIVVTEGNHNNELGLPLTICKLETDTTALVVEMGMRGLGQIDFLCKIANPDYGIITNIGKAHYELLGSQENIAKAKCELLPYIKPFGCIALNVQDRPFLEPWLSSCRGEILWYFGNETNSLLWADSIEQSEEGVRYRLHWGDQTVWIGLPVPGVHNVANSLAAIAIAHTLGVSWDTICDVLQQSQLTKMRLDVTKTKEQVVFINDAYNANPDSMRSALEVLMQKKGNRKVAVLGDMYELGSYEVPGHQEVGRKASSADYIIAVGTLGHIIGETAEASGCLVDYAVDNQEAIAFLKKYLQPEDVVLVKGSRGMKMEEIVQNFMG